MKKRAIIAVCVALLVGTPSANGQGFLKGLKKLGEKIEKTLESNTSSNCSKEGNNSKSNLRLLEMPIQKIGIEQLKQEKVSEESCILFL